MKKRDIGWSLIGGGALLCALACAAPLLGLGLLGFGAGLERAGIGVGLVGLAVLGWALVRRRRRSCGEAGHDC